jgi:Phosphoserine phosphatase RsbU, N-terminal domain
VSALDDLRLDYRAAFLRYLARREEAVLNAGYELGRSSLAAGISILELVRVHHDVLVGVLRDTPSAEVPDVAEAASDLLLEVLASYAMSQGPIGPGRLGGP